MGECLRFGIKSVPQTASAWVKRSKARVPFTSWCCNIVIGNGSRVIIMGVTYMFNIFIKISRAMSLIYFMKHIKLPNTYNIIYRQPINVIANLMMTKFHLNTTVVAIFLDCKQSGFFSKSVKKSITRGVRVLRAWNTEPPDLLFDCSRVLEYTKIRTVLQSTIFPNVCLWRCSLCSDLVLTLKNCI